MCGSIPAAQQVPWAIWRWAQGRVNVPDNGKRNGGKSEVVKITKICESTVLSLDKPCFLLFGAVSNILLAHEFHCTKYTEKDRGERGQRGW